MPNLDRVCRLLHAAGIAAACWYDGWLNAPRFTSRAPADRLRAALAPHYTLQCLDTFDYVALPSVPS